MRLNRERAGTAIEKMPRLVIAMSDFRRYSACSKALTDMGILRADGQKIEVIADKAVDSKRSDSVK